MIDNTQHRMVVDDKCEHEKNMNIKWIMEKEFDKMSVMKINNYITLYIIISMKLKYYKKKMFNVE